MDREYLKDDEPVDEAYRYGAVIVMARAIRWYGNRYNFAQLLAIPDRQAVLGVEDVLKIEHVLWQTEFCGMEYVIKEKYVWIKGPKLRMGSDDSEVDVERLYMNLGKEERDLAYRIAELIYRIYLYGENDLKEVQDELEDEEKPKYIVWMSQVILREYLLQMNTVFDKGEYPMEIVLQMLGYPAMDKEEYDRRISRMQEDVRRWSL